MRCARFRALRGLPAHGQELLEQRRGRRGRHDVREEPVEAADAAPGTARRAQLRARVVSSPAPSSSLPKRCSQRLLDYDVTFYVLQ